MGLTPGLDDPRFPSPLRDLLEASGGSAQERAWTEFLSAYSRLILYVARQMRHDHDSIMDRYAFVVERLREHDCRRLRSFTAEGRGKFTTWLIIVVRRLCLDHDRQKHGRAAAPGAGKPAAPRRLVEIAYDPQILDRMPDGAPSVDERMDREQLLQRLETVIANLSPSDQLLLSLRYRDDRSAREIASLMSLPSPFHVYRRLNRVHDALRQALTAPSERGYRPTGAGNEPHAVEYPLGGNKPLDPGT